MSWTEDALTLWGGIRADRFDGEKSRRVGLADGAVFSLDRGQWEALPASPLAPRTGHVAWQIEEGLMIWGGYDPVYGPARAFQVHMDGAVLDREHRTWRAIGSWPLAQRHDPHRAIAGQRLHVWGGSRRGPGPSRFISMRFADDSQEGLRSGPQEVSMVVSGGDTLGGEHIDDELQGAAYDRVDESWEQFRTPAALHHSGWAWGSGGWLAMLSSTGTLQAFEPTGGISAAPLRLPEQLPWGTCVQAGPTGAVVVLPGRQDAYWCDLDGQAARFRPLALPELRWQPGLGTDGKSVLLWGGHDGSVGGEPCRADGWLIPIPDLPHQRHA